VSVRLNLNAKYEEFDSSADLKTSFLLNVRTSIARAINIKLGRVVINSLKKSVTDGSKMRRRRMTESESDSEEAVVNFEILPPETSTSSGMPSEKSVEDCISELNSQVASPTSALQTDEFFSTHKSTKSADDPESMLASSIVSAGSQADDTFSTLEEKIGVVAEPDPTADDSAGGNSLVTAVGAAGAGLLVVAVMLLAARRYSQFKSAATQEKVDSAPADLRKLSSDRQISIEASGGVFENPILGGGKQTDAVAVSNDEQEEHLQAMI